MTFSQAHFSHLLTRAVDDGPGAVKELQDFCALFGFRDAAFVFNVVLARRAFPEMCTESTEALQFRSYPAWVHEQQLLAALQGLPWPERPERPPPAAMPEAIKTTGGECPPHG